jgi:hypothetical protein
MHAYRLIRLYLTNSHTKRRKVYLTFKIIIIIIPHEVVINASETQEKKTGRKKSSKFQAKRFPRGYPMQACGNYWPCKLRSLQLAVAHAYLRGGETRFVKLCCCCMSHACVTKTE